jgi:hypothetical protein
MLESQDLSFTFNPQVSEEVSCGCLCKKIDREMLCENAYKWLNRSRKEPFSK